MFRPTTTPALWQGAFRPLFLAAGMWACLSMLLWVLMLQGLVTLPTHFAPMDWHVHEMLFGFVMAAIGGFLLTAIPNWTSRPSVSGSTLAILTGLWVIGRAASASSEVLGSAPAALLDLLFPVALVGVVARELLAGRNRRNYPLLLPILALGVANALMHLDAMGVSLPPGIGWRLGLSCVLLLIAVIGGRIIPAFTRNWLRPRGGPLVPLADRLDTVALGALVVGLSLWVAMPGHPGTGIVLAVAGVIHLGRLARWQGFATRREPLLAVLHAGYLWFACGVGLLGLSGLTPVIPQSAAIHALTAGAIGTMTLAVMTRATLGHSGRALTADGLLTVIFALVILAAMARVAAAWPVAPGTLMLTAAGGAWIAAFALFVGHHLPMAVTPRA